MSVYIVLGTLLLEVKVLLKYLIYDEKIFTLEYLNDKISEFQLGYFESTDRPSTIKRENIVVDSVHKLGQSGMYVLIYYDMNYHVL